VQIEGGDNTRWLQDDEAFALTIRGAVTLVARSVTGGQVPAVTVIPEEDRNPIDERARQ
jgi:hypothetical protein